MRRVDEDMRTNENRFGALNPTKEELQDWRRRLTAAIAISNHPKAREFLRDLDERFSSGRGA